MLEIKMAGKSGHIGGVRQFGAGDIAGGNPVW